MLLLYIWLMICRYSTLVWFYTWRPVWTRVYRFLFERRWKTLPITKYESLRAIAAVLRPDWWRADGFKQLRDVTSSPQYVQAVWDRKAPQPTQGFDCDEFAVYIVTAVNGSAGVMKDPVTAQFMSVVWLNPDLSYGGHNVALLTFAMADGSKMYSYMDYKLPSIPRATVEEVAQDIRSHYGKLEAIGVIWGIFTPDMTPIKVVLG